MEKCYQRAHYVFLGIAILALILSFFVEYIIEIQPCTLCQLQRIPYFAIGILALIGLFVSFKRGLLRLIQLCFLAGIILATYHSCIQFGLLGCSCQKMAPAWRILSLPPPLYNGVFSLIVLISAEIFLIRTKKKS